ncbi:MAG: dockerin type I domain-containing protein, partial [Acutalibacteraceae bacterium]|nr:dockerin type I domain-containing protein [Acutalibacteraceae bacterium]
DYKIINDESTMIGDVNSDMAVNGKDVLTLRKYIVGIVDSFSINTQNADVNNDGNINGKDVLMLRKALIGLVELVPVESPSDIVDTTAEL